METQHGVTGLILAGGAGRRVGGRDKGLIPWRGKPLVEHVLLALENQVDKVDTLIISCNRNLDEYQKYNTRLVSDEREGFQGPLAGIEAAKPHVQTEFLLLAACDMPLLPADLVARLRRPLIEAHAAVDISFVHDGEREQYLCAMLRSTCLQGLDAYLADGQRAVRRWYARHPCVAVDFSDCPGAFRNYNHIDAW
jgi:molybdopterin-guanine dinucleotide biosynthesis protein A